jgi:hypothetical protein
MACIAARLNKPTEKVATIKCALNQGSETTTGEISTPGKKIGSTEQNKANKIDIQSKLAIGKNQD